MIALPHSSFEPPTAISTGSAPIPLSRWPSVNHPIATALAPPQVSPSARAASPSRQRVEALEVPSAWPYPEP